MNRLDRLDVTWYNKQTFNTIRFYSPAHQWCADLRPHKVSWAHSVWNKRYISSKEKKNAVFASVCFAQILSDEFAALGKFTVSYSMCQGALSLWQLHAKIPFPLSNVNSSPCLYVITKYECQNVSVDLCPFKSKRTRDIFHSAAQNCSAY